MKHRTYRDRRGYLWAGPVEPPEQSQEHLPLINDPRPSRNVGDSIRDAYLQRVADYDRRKQESIALGISTFPYHPTGAPKRYAARSLDVLGTNQRCPECRSYGIRRNKDVSMECSCGVKVTLQREVGK